ncbi:MAG TPA: ATP-dependent Clp protease adaptor ClpS [Bacteroidales bacterium]|jgi:ATP-dependent Clp protease adaptor protein ClpS.
MDIQRGSNGEKLTNSADVKELILWDDDTSNIEFKIKSLVDVCKISEKDSINIALDSLLDGSAKITTGKYDSLIQMQKAFQKKLITTTIE